MANRPHYPQWPAQYPASAPLAYGEPLSRGFGPGMPFPQRSSRLSAPGFHQFPPRVSGAPSGPPFGPPGHVAYRNAYPSPSSSSPGFNNNIQGWSPYPRAISPNVNNSQLQVYGAHGNNFSVGFPSQAQGQQAQQGLHGEAVVGHSVVSGVPWSSDSRPNSAAVKPLFLNWIDESGGGSASSELLGGSGDRGSSLRASSNNSPLVTSSEVYRLVDRVEDAIGKILALTDLQGLGSGAEWGVCPFDPHHVVPAEALFRHTLQCRSSLGGAVEASSLLECLQYPQTVESEPFAHDERMTDRHLGAESSSNNGTLSFENVALFSAGHAPSKRLDLAVVKQELGYVVSEYLSEIPRMKAKVGTNDLVEELECRTLTLSTTRQQFDPRGSLFFYGESPGVVLTSLAHYSSKSFGDAVSSMPYFLRVELKKCPFVTFKSDRNEEAKLLRVVLPSRIIENAGVGNRRTEVEEREQESHGVVEESISINRIGMSDSEADGLLTRIQHVDELEETDCVRILPSMLWNLRKELETWKDTPSQCSRIVLHAATCLGRVRKASIVEWLLAHSPAYGVVLDVAMAAHISCLVQLYLKALGTQSTTLVDQSFAMGLNKRDTSISVDTVVLESPIYAEASTWLASWLSHLYGPINSKAVVLDILKHCLNLCARFLSAVPLDLHFQQGGSKIREKTDDAKGTSDEEYNLSMDSSKMFSKLADSASEDILGAKQIGAAMDAVYERANFERYIKSWMSINNTTKPQRIADYDMTVMSANNERAKRRNYHAVCEHDGLTWQRSHQEEKRNKSKAELLAEERDYKRRRTSYRGKKLKRTPLQVLHDIIENHMTEITEAGGIGCFSKQPSRTDLDSQLQLQGSILWKPKFQHQSGSAHDSKLSNIEMAGNMLRLYDDYRETSSSVRNESRPSSERRHDDERHHNSRR